MTSREIVQAISGFLLATFFAAVSTTIVVNALPRISSDLGASQRQYTWVMAAALLAATATTPVWGKLADRLSRKLLVQLSITIFATSSILAGFSPSAEILIVLRAVQGLGAGGLVALIQIVMASIVSPRQRGRYLGYFGAVAALAMIGGPPLGGLIVEAPYLGWRWCFWITVPIAVASSILLQKTLHLRTITASARPDWAGAFLIPAGIVTLLVWVTLAGERFAWISWASVAFLAASMAMTLLAILVERRVPDPVVPPHLLRRRTLALATVAKVAAGISLISAPFFFAQYFQIARGHTPTQSGMLTIPMMIGMVLSATVCGRLVTRTGRWKRYVVAGSVLVAVALVLLGTVNRTTSLLLVGVYIATLGIGIGGSDPPLTVAAQNSLEYRNLGSGTSMMTFFGSLGGAAGVSVLGAIFASHVSNSITNRLASLPDGHPLIQDGISAALDYLNEPSGQPHIIVAQAYGDATALIFVVASVVAMIAVVSVLFIRETPLRTTVDLET